jgi:bifunctional non-homologous end joining protein LigD
MRLLRFDSLRAALAKLPALDAILDGEVVCLDEHGVSRCNYLLDRKIQPVFYAFDLIWLNGEDLRQQPLIERKQRLSGLVRQCDWIIYARHVEKDGNDLFKEICARDFEGVVAKRKLGIYKDDGTGWIKIKNRSYSQAEGRRELFEQGK